MARVIRDETKVAEKMFLSLALLSVLLTKVCYVDAKSVKRAPGKDSADYEEKWLEDWMREDDYMYDMQSDSAGPQHIKPFYSCPPPPKKVPEHACLRKKCTSDKECRGAQQRCCHNGCTFTCMSAMLPPPVVDWVREPKRRLNSGNSWLVGGPAAPVQGKTPVEPCSTTVLASDEEPMLCPHGFTCHLDYYGDLKKGIPNRGRCVPENNDAEADVSAGGSIAGSAARGEGSKGTNLS